MTQPRITVEIIGNGAPSVVHLSVNEEGLKILLDELRALSRNSDHFHLFAPEWGVPDGPLSLKPYGDNAATAGHLKVLFRPDDWDKKYYPHLFEENGSAE